MDLVKCKSYVLDIKTLQVKMKHHLYKNNIYIFLCHEFAQTYRLMIFALILLKFCGIENL
jgi:hypothetical protein